MPAQEDLPNAIRESVSGYKKNLNLVQDESSLDESLKTLVPDLAQEPRGLRKLVIEYCQLAMKPELSDADNKRMAEIYKLAEYDEKLDYWIAKIDESVEPILLALLQQQKSERLFLEDFIHEIKNMPSEEITLKEFKKLAQKVCLPNYVIDSHIHFQDGEYCRQAICQTSFGAIFVVSWKPGQCSSIHSHESDFSVIRVYKGTLTHELYEKEKEVVFHEGRKGWRDHYILREEQLAGENEWVCVGTKQAHRLVNKSTQNLVTLHFRLFGQPIGNEDGCFQSSRGTSSNQPENWVKPGSCDNSKIVIRY
jgi:hypothetical protein